MLTDEKMRKESQRANAIVNNSDDSVLWFGKFGSTWNVTKSHHRQLQTFP